MEELKVGTRCTIAGGSITAVIVAKSADHVLLVANKSFGSEYICGSYPQITAWNTGIPNISWSWGHYFDSIIGAAEYWKEGYGEC